MCGIAGVCGPGASAQTEAVRRMVAALEHRGPDGQGVYAAPSGACVLGHTRLAILDLSTASAQPMLAADERAALTYNGEIYNFRALREELSAAGESFDTTGDTEVLLRVMMRDGAKGLPGLNGMFALALWDERAGRLLLARDRFGQKPLYYARVGELIVFASEVRALLASGLVARRCNPRSLCGYLSYGAVQGPETIIDGVSLLPPASALHWHAGSDDELSVYWQPPRDMRPLAAGELRELFTAAVDRHLVSDAPVGVFLSGGIDSSAIAAVAARVRAEPVTSLAVVFPDQPADVDREYARLVADREHTRHVEVPLTGEDMRRLLGQALAAMDQPTGDGINTYIVAHAARQAGLKVALSGLGGDELFGGYSSFVDVPRMLRLARGLGPLRRPVATVFAALGTQFKRVEKIGDLLAAPPGVVAAFLVRRRALSSAQLRSLLPGMAGSGWIAGQDDAVMRRLAEWTRDRDRLDAVGLLEMDRYMGQMLLRDSDVMGMAHGLEIRLPFLDADFADGVLRLGADARRPGATPKRHFVAAMGDALPSAVAERRKQGFALPFEHWMTSDLRDEVDAGLDALAALGDPWSAHGIAALWRGFLHRPAQVGWFRPWSLFVLGRYIREHRLAI